jgi:hypothetical protein
MRPVRRVAHREQAPDARDLVAGLPSCRGAPVPPPGPSWRADVLALTWQDLLRSRNTQVATVAASFSEAVSATETATLPALRDASARPRAGLPNLPRPDRAAQRSSWTPGRRLPADDARGRHRGAAAIAAAHDDQFAPRPRSRWPPSTRSGRGSDRTARGVRRCSCTPVGRAALPSLLEPKSSAFETLWRPAPRARSPGLAPRPSPPLTPSTSRTCARSSGGRYARHGSSASPARPVRRRLPVRAIPLRPQRQTGRLYVSRPIRTARAYPQPHQRWTWAWAWWATSSGDAVPD